MLRASSEMAVAMRVTSVDENPIWAARARPFCRAATMSTSDWIGTRMSSGTSADSGLLSAVRGSPIEMGQTLFQVERGCHTLQGQAQLNHGKCDFRLDADDDCFGAAQADHVRDVQK